SAPGKMRGRLFATLGKAFGNSSPVKDDYLDLLKLQYEVFSFMRKNGAVALDEHVTDVEKSAIFSKYPSFLKRHHAVEFFRDALKQIVNGTASADELDVLLDAELDTHHEESAIPVALLQKTADSLPGLGIVAAVLGIVITMGHLDGGPEEIGHHVAAALIGTFLGILLCYGLLHPIATNAAHHGGAWKVAYADFVTAMMALFIVLWLLTQADMRLRQQIAQYFRSPGVLSGGTMITSDVNEAKSREPKVVSNDIIVVQGKGEQERLEGEAKEVQAAVARAAQENPDVAKLKDQVMVEVTDAGLVIEVVDRG